MTKEPTWIELFRGPHQGKVVVAFNNESEVLSVREPRDREELIDLLSRASKANNVLVAPPGKPVPAVDPPLPVEQPLKGKRIVLDPGHNERQPGARGGAPDPDGERPVKEEVLNRLQANVLSEALRDLGATVLVLDPVPEDLWSLGQNAAGADLFLSLHHNAFDGHPHYTCVCVHSAVGSGASKAFASRVAKAISERIDEWLFQKSGQLPGVYPVPLTVLRSAEGVAKAGTPCVLVESYFCDVRTLTPEVAAERSKEAALAILEAIGGHFGVNLVTLEGRTGVS